MTKTKPYWIHDCESCTFLGQEPKNLVDFYICRCESMITVIARQSNEPDDYISGLEFYDVNYFINIAVNLAIEKDLLSFNQIVRVRPDIRNMMVLLERSKPIIRQ